EAIAQKRTEWAINAAGHLRDAQGTLVDQVGGDAEAGRVIQTRASAQHGAAAFAHTPRGAPARREVTIGYRPERLMLVKYGAGGRVQEKSGVLRHRRGIELPPDSWCDRQPRRHLPGVLRPQGKLGYGGGGMHRDGPSEPEVP